MKTLGALIGLMVALAIEKWLPSTLSSIKGIPALLGYMAAIGAGLSSLWVTALGRLSAFDKLEDLTSHQKTVALETATRFRNGVIESIAANTLIWVSATILIAVNSIVDSYGPLLLSIAIFVPLGAWLAGFFQSIRVIKSIEVSRIAIAFTQDEEKRRAAYLAQMRADAIKSPVDRDDLRLKQYNETNPGLS